MDVPNAAVDVPNAEGSGRISSLDDLDRSWSGHRLRPGIDISNKSGQFATWSTSFLEKLDQDSNRPGARLVESAWSNREASNLSNEGRRISRESGRMSFRDPGRWDPSGASDSVTVTRARGLFCGASEVEEKLMFAPRPANGAGYN